jgi:hypothetical protein
VAFARSREPSHKCRYGLTEMLGHLSLIPSRADSALLASALKFDFRTGTLNGDRRNSYRYRSYSLGSFSALYLIVNGCHQALLTCNLLE